MEWTDITDQNRTEYNSLVTHPLQSFEWGEFRKLTGVKVIRRGLVTHKKLAQAFTLTLHKVPKTKYTIGYLPKGTFPTEEVVEELERIGKEEKCIFIQLEPNVQLGVTLSGSTPSSTRSLSLRMVRTSDGGAKWQDPISKLLNLKLRPSFHPLFTKYTFILDLTKSEEELLKNLHPKSRYNIKIAQKRKVKINEDNSDEAFQEYLRLTKETTTRQKFYAHTTEYHKKMWQTLRVQNSKFKIQNSYNYLSAHLLKAIYQPESESDTTLVTWILFVFHDTLYYPYGASSSQFRNVMASNLIMWEAIKFGKKLGLKKFDMWGALGENPNPKDEWYGFHRFKEGYGAQHTEFVGSYDLVINPLMYQVYKVADKARWIFLRIKKGV